MSTDLLTDLAEYGHYHREAQQPVRPVEAAQHALTPVVPPARPNYPMRRAGVAVVAAVLVILLISIPALLRGREAESPAESVVETTLLEVPGTTAGETETPSAETYLTGPSDDGESQQLVMVHTLEDSSLIGLAIGSVWRSTDNGENWVTWHEHDHEFDLMAVAPDGAVLVVRNPNSTDESAGNGSTINDTPEIHRFDPATGEWGVIPLPRPELPVPDLAPQEDNIDECGLSGLHSWVDGNAIVVGDRIVILGDHRVVGDGICDEGYQFLWTSNDGIDWSLVPTVDVDGYLIDLVWTGDRYIGIGSPRPWWSGGGGPTPQIWTTTDLGAWIERDLDLSTFPDGAMIQIDAVGAASFGGGLPVGILHTGELLKFVFAVFRYRPGLDASLADIDALRQWRLDAGLTESPFGEEISLEDSLAMDGIDFPLDENEIRFLNGYYDVKEPYGALTLTSSDGTDWEVSYTSG